MYDRLLVTHHRNYHLYCYASLPLQVGARFFFSSIAWIAELHNVVADDSLLCVSCGNFSHFLFSSSHAPAPNIAFRNPIFSIPLSFRQSRFYSDLFLSSSAAILLPYTTILTPPTPLCPIPPLFCHFVRCAFFLKNFSLLYMKYVI